MHLKIMIFLNGFNNYLVDYGSSYIEELDNNKIRLVLSISGSNKTFNTSILKFPPHLNWALPTNNVTGKVVFDVNVANKFGSFNLLGRVKGRERAGLLNIGHGWEQMSTHAYAVMEYSTI